MFKEYQKTSFTFMQEMDGYVFETRDHFPIFLKYWCDISTLNGDRNARIASHLNRFPKESPQPFCQSMLDLEEKWRYLVSPLFFFQVNKQRLQWRSSFLSLGIFDVEANDTRCIPAASL